MAESVERGAFVGREAKAALSHHASAPHLQKPETKKQTHWKISYHT